MAGLRGREINAAGQRTASDDAHHLHLRSGRDLADHGVACLVRGDGPDRLRRTRLGRADLPTTSSTASRRGFPERAVAMAAFAQPAMSAPLDPALQDADRREVGIGDRAVEVLGQDAHDGLRVR